jgi:outer membrane protein OmpA-like peptidoglycan-associated protein
MKLRLLAVALGAIALPLAVNAQPISGLYIGAGAGVNIMQDEPVKGPGPVAPNTNVQTNLGGTGLFAVGWGFGNGFRAELEFDYRYNGLKDVTGPGGGPLSGSEQKYGPMVNVAYDFTTISPSFVPYIGAGAGYQFANISTGGLGTKGAFAAQAILGAEFPIASVPGLGVTAEYRFMALTGDRSYPGVTLGNDFNHSVLIGVRYAFGEAPPPAPAAMPVADMGAKTFLVFFDWDKADLTARSEGIVRDAAAYATKTQYTRIDVDGNTDTSGTPAYNQGLSERRAKVVAAELVRDGVPQAAITMHAYGDTKLLVPTGPNTREPQNRRVEIVYH